MTKEIITHNGQIAIVDDNWYEMLSTINWRCQPKKCTSYAYARFRIGYGDRVHEFMHRIILGAPKGILVDHINGNGLDNREENLRLVSGRQNQMNRKKSLSVTSSIYKGVTVVNGKWQAQIRLNYKSYYLGLYATQEDAAIVYNKAAIKYYGEHACLNVIQNKGENHE